MGESIRLRRRRRVGRIVCALLLMGLSAAAAQGQVLRIEVVDPPDTVQNDLFVQAAVYSSRPLTSVTAEVPGRAPVALAFNATTDRWTGTLSFAGLAQNTTYVVTLRAVDDLANAALPLQYNVRQDPQPPVLTITDPVDRGFYAPDIRLRASCTDGGVPCTIEVTASIPGGPMPGFRFLASGVGSIDTIVSLPAGQQQIKFAGTDAANATTVDEFRTVFVDTSTHLTRLPLSFPGRVLDISTTHAIVLDDVSVPNRLLLYDRTTSDSTVLRTLHLEDVFLAKLVSGAAVYTVLDKNQNTTRLFEWRANVTTDLGPMAGFAIRASAQYIAWHSATGPSIIRRNVVTGTNVTIAPAPAPPVTTFSLDVGSNGDVVWNADVGGHLQVFRARGEIPTTTQLTTDATSKFNVVTDGTNVVFQRQPTNPPTTEFPVEVVLLTPGGEILLAQAMNFQLSPAGGYAVENQWVAFVKINGFLREIWRRAPDGTTTLLDSGFSSTEQLQANGDVLIAIANGARVLIRADGTRQELHQLAGAGASVEGELFSSAGKFVFLDNEWHLATGPYLLKFSAVARSMLAEGSTGSFFDTDIAIFNPSATDTVEAKVRYLREDGTNIENTHQLEPRSHTLIHTDTVPGLEAAAFSTVVEVADGSPLVVERLMTWDSTGYGGHASNAVDRPRLRWMFAEGAQGIFDTFFLLVNDNDDSVAVRMTFLREGLSPLTHTLTVGAHARRTFHAGELPGLVNVAFSTVIDTDLPILAERAMYWDLPIPKGPLFWGGGHDTVGAPELSHRWFFAEGATGPLFDTFILIGNPHDRTVIAQLIFHTEGGTQVAKQVTLPPLSRTTVNIETLDPQIASVGVATVVVVPFETPVIAERALYWGIDIGGMMWTDGHASFGATTDASRWAVSDGRVGGERHYQTFVLVNNSFGTIPAHVKVTFIRDDGQEFVRNYVAQTGQRLTILAHEVPELADSTFSVIVETPVSEPVSVERATYWDVNGVVWAAGANVVGTRLP